MSWSQQVMNGLETVFRTLDFAKHVQEGFKNAGDGRGLSHFEYATTYKGEVAAIPRWWLLGFVDEEELVLQTGREKASDWRASHDGQDPVAPVGLVYTFFWRNRETDRAPLLPPQIIVGAGSIRFKEWGRTRNYAGGSTGYLWELGVALNETRSGGDFDIPPQPARHLELLDGFAWREPVLLESLDSGDKIKALVRDSIEHIVGKVKK